MVTASATCSATAALVSALSVAAKATLTATLSSTTTQRASRSAVFSSAAVLVTSVANNYVSQAGIEVLLLINSSAIVSQTGVEAVTVPIPTAIVSQTGVEVLISNTKFIRTIPASVVVRGSRFIPSSGKFKSTSSRSIPGSGRFIAGNRIVPATARFRARLSRSLIARAKIGSIDRFIPASAAIKKRTGQPIPAIAEIGYRRYIPSHVALLGKPTRFIPAYARFRVPGMIPATASFWNTNPLVIGSDEQTKVMSRASRLVGGSIGTRFQGSVTSANNAPNPVNWDQPYPIYNDTFWPRAITQPGTLVPWPTHDPRAKDMDFNWAWPNDTGDFAPAGFGITTLTTDPSFGIDMYRRTFGVPFDARIAGAISGKVIIGVQFSPFDVEIYTARLNGRDLPFLLWEFTEGQVFPINLFGLLFGSSVRVAEWAIPPGFILPGNNVLAIEVETELTFGLFARNAAFLMTLNYIPKGMGLPQVIG